MPLVSHARRVHALVLVATAFACGQGSIDAEPEPEPEPEPTREPDIRSTYLDVFLDPDTRLCPPTLARLDEEVVRLAEALGLEADPEERIVLYYGDYSVRDRCGIDEEIGEFTSRGCTQREGLWVASQPGAESHEFVHALRAQAGLAGPVYWEEGLATNLGTWRPYAEFLVWASADRRPSQALRSTEGIAQPEYTESAHFIAFLEHAYDANRVRALSRVLGEGVEPGAAFQQELGASLEEAEARWLAEADQMYELGPLCDEHIAVGFDPVVIRGEIGCDVPGVLGPGINASVDMFLGPRYCFDAPPDTTLTVTVRGDEEHGMVQARSVTTERGCPAHEPNRGTNVPPGLTHDFETEGCRWSMVYLSWLEGDAYEIELSVE